MAGHSWACKVYDSLLPFPICSIGDGYSSSTCPHLIRAPPSLKSLCYAVIRNMPTQGQAKRRKQMIRAGLGAIAWTPPALNYCNFANDSHWTAFNVSRRERIVRTYAGNISHTAKTRACGDRAHSWRGYYSRCYRHADKNERREDRFNN